MLFKLTTMKSIMQRFVLVLLAVDVISGIAIDYNNGLNQDGYRWENFKNKEGNVTDRHKLLQLYALMCPVPPPCGAKNYYGLELNTTDDPYDKYYKSCKECSCRDDCLTRKNCCPDLTAAFMEHECVDTALYRSPILIDKSPDIEDVHIVRTDPEEDDPANDALGGAATEIFYTSNSWNLMVTSCPPDATDEQVVYCSAGKTVPVSSNSSQISYRNVHCAACNHDDGDLVNWKVTFVCNEEMEEVAFGSRGFKANMKDYGCVVKYDPQQTYGEQEYNPPSYPCNYYDYYTYKLGRCNVTGLWSEYDPDIEWACEHLNLAYKWRYKNVFCYICNPSLVSTSSELLYDRCNVTGLWKEYNAHVETRCLSSPRVQRLAPFKNVYCIRCNGYKRINKFDMTKAYGLSRIDEVYVTESHPIPMVTIYLQVKGANVVEQSREAIQFLYPDFENFQYDVKREELTQRPAGDMAFLYDTFHDACGFERLCNNYSSNVGAAINAIDKGGLNDQCESCSCDSACAANEDCCIDLIIEKMPYTCIDEPRLLTIEHSITDFKPDEGASMTVIGRCLNRDDTDLIDRCETDNFDGTDILQYMPVFQNGVYKNIYCLMCNIHTPEPVFKVKVICNNYLETALSKTMTQLFEVVRKHCKVQVVPPGYDRHCSTRKQLVDNPSIISSCNQTGLWFNYDERIAAGCEDDGHSTLSFMPIYTVHLSDGTMFFKNYLCFLCNPRESQVTYDSCNEDNQLDTICQETKLVPSWLPYKNVYCYLCNLPPAPYYTFQQTNNLPTPADMNMQMSVDLGSTYRMLFALSQEEWSDFYPDGSDPNPVCSLGFSYDYTAKMCRVILCSPDRVLVNYECIHMAELIPTGGLNISLDFTLDNHEPRMGFGIDFNKNVYMELLFGKIFMSLKFLCKKVESLIEQSLGEEGLSVRSKMCAIITPNACDMYDNYEKGMPKPPLVRLQGNMKFIINLEFAFYNNVRVKTSLEVLNHIFRKPYEFNELNSGFRLTASFEENLKDFTSLRTEGNPCEIEMLYPLAHEEFLSATTPGVPLVTAKIDTCLQVQLTEAEFSHNETTNTISIHNGTTILREGEFMLIDSTIVRVCQSDYYYTRAQPQTGLTPLHRAHNIFSYVFTMISLLCILLTFTTYCMFPDLRTVPGRNIMSLCASLFVAQGSLQFSSFILTYEVICVPFAVLTHYSWLATFCAMNVCSFHMYRLFYNKMMSSPAALKSLEHVRYYLLYTYALPLLIVGLTLSVHYGLSRGEFSGYGKNVCFLSDIYTITFTFIVPAALIFITNFAFFAMAFYAIKTSPRVACTKKDKREFYIYLKLCALTGISWPLQIIDGMLPLTAFSFIAVFINALQGLYIFISYVCNARVYRLYDRLWTVKGATYMEDDTPATTSSAYHKSTKVSFKTDQAIKGD